MQFGEWFNPRSPFFDHEKYGMKASMEKLISRSMEIMGVESAKRGHIEVQIIQAHLRNNHQYGIEWWIPLDWMDPAKLNHLVNGLGYDPKLHKMAQLQWPGYNREGFDYTHNMTAVEISHDPLAPRPARSCLDCSGMHPDYSVGYLPQFIGHRESCSKPTMKPSGQGVYTASIGEWDRKKLNLKGDTA